MLRSYKYRLTPTKAQERTLLHWLGLTRELYNAALQERRDGWQKHKLSVTALTQMKEVPEVRIVRPEFKDVPVVVLRGALRRLDKGFQAFFRRVKAGEKPGYPRFRSKQRWRSILIDDLHDRMPIVSGGKRVSIPLLGKVKFKQHRPMLGKPKAMHITLDNGRWYLTFACVDVSANPLPPSDKSVGVDLGLHHFAATSDGQIVPNPRPLKQARVALERAARKVSRRKKGSRRRRVAVRILARHHAHVANIRREHHIGLARKLVGKYGTIFIEALNVKGLAAGSLAKSVNDAGWAGFLHWLNVKAEEAGRSVVEVPPAGTSQTCPACGRVKRKELSERMHRCECGLVCDRDVAAAQVILKLGTSLRGAAPPVRGRRRSAKGESKLAGPEHTVLPVEAI